MDEMDGENEKKEKAQIKKTLPLNAAAVQEKKRITLERVNGCGDKLAAMLEEDEDDEEEVDELDDDGDDDGDGDTDGEDAEDDSKTLKRRKKKEQKQQQHQQNGLHVERKKNTATAVCRTLFCICTYISAHFLI